MQEINSVYAAFLQQRQLAPRKRVKRLLRLTHSAWTETRDCAPHAARGGGPSRLAQLVDAVYLGVKYHLTPGDYYRYGLYQADARRRIAEYVSSEVHGNFSRMLRSKLGTSVDCLRDKRQFYAACLTSNLRVVPGVAEFDSGRLQRWTQDGPSRLPQRD